MSASRILVLGAGGREHAIAWRLARDPHAPEVHVAPGNEGVAASFPCHALRETDAAAVVALARELRAELVVVGPEAPLAAGVADVLREAGFTTFGASREAAQLEASKWYAKQVMAEAGVPTAAAVECHAVAQTLDAMARFAPPWVLKADGLAAGKGVLVTSERAQAEAFARDCLDGARFGDGGRRLVFEEFLPGVEASVIAICDGEQFVLLPAARDHQRAFDGDQGETTGGRGAFAPLADVTPALEVEVGEQIVAPVLRVMAARGAPYRGALYVGLMLTPAGAKVVEFNARFGDPETQATFPLLGGVLSDVLEAAASGTMASSSVAASGMMEISSVAASGRGAGGSLTRLPGAAVVVAITDSDYPGTLRGTGRIEGLEALEASDPEVTVFHAGTRREQGLWCVAGGRAAYVLARGATIAAARTRVYAAIDRLGGEGWRVRRDIAAGADQRTLEHEPARPAVRGVD